MDDIEELRTIEVLRNEKWEKCYMKDLVVGEEFRMFEDGKLFKDQQGHTTWVVQELPYVNKEGIWTVIVKL